MYRKAFINADEGVAPVMAVTLLIAITLVLVMVIVPMVLDLGGQNQDVPPNTRFEFEYDPVNDSVRITHDGGENILTDNLYVRGQGINHASDLTELGGPNNDRWAGTNSSKIDGENAITIRDSAVIQVSASGEHVIRLVWESNEADISTELDVYRGTAST